MKKKILSALLSITVLAVPVLANARFSDLPDSHWGYSSVSKLVADGTVNGYEDGTFRPSGQVKRAEFVKMMGEGTVNRGKDFSDVDSSHWAYKYVMTSQFDDGSNEFKPSQPITRGETITLLWKRAGSPADEKAPSIITSQASDKQAVSWAYNNGIMLGDDGVNLRLDGTLSRVEAAALIVRARETDFSAANKNFTDTASDALLKRVFESFHLFDNNPAYSAEKIMTNGELSRAALRLAGNEFNITYGSYVYKTAFEHTYAKDVTIMSNICFGETNATKEFADKTATREDMVAALSAAIIRKANKPVSFGNVGNYYKDITGKVDSKKDVYLTFANENGIQLNGDGTIGAGKPATYKDMAAVLLQLDGIVGTQTAISTRMNGDKYVKEDVKLNHNFAKYPKNESLFTCVIDGIPNSVFEKELTGKAPSENFDFAREFGEMYASHLSKITNGVKSTYGIDMELVIYPDLVWDNGRGFTIRALCKINDVGKTPLPVGTIFSDEELLTEAKGFITKGMNFFVEINTTYAIFM